jgi:hypothetical protein
VNDMRVIPNDVTRKYKNKTSQSERCRKSRKAATCDMRQQGV